ncbi:Hypothetical protein CINCED_3A005413 [Cinara cedri]|uniref:Uncharacterized protein n=1 Tax=Cinara cedri TaxID=506608 RepID=A0A5E4M5E9_9HEMI|nr:Hypothetical protein CINCED_3A005413 [Cinara cedri]
MSVTKEVVRKLKEVSNSLRDIENILREQKCANRSSDDTSSACACDRLRDRDSSSSGATLVGRPGRYSNGLAETGRTKCGQRHDRPRGGSGWAENRGADGRRKPRGKTCDSSVYRDSKGGKCDEKTASRDVCGRRERDRDQIRCKLNDIKQKFITFFDEEVGNTLSEHDNCCDG